MPSGRVLIVDDQKGITAIIEEYFTSLGYEVDVAHDGAAAVGRATAVRPDVVLLDVNMPEVSGDEVLDRLQAIDSTVPIVMLTGEADEELAQTFLQRGALDYVAKPFQFDTLERVVASAIAAGHR
jgi:DNA-binding response OmpR family regulator